MNISHEEYVILNEDQKANILNNLNQELEKQKAKYLNNVSKLKEENNKGILRSNESTTPHYHWNTEDTYETHLDMLQNAKYNLEKIKNDIKQYNNSQYYMSEQDNDIRNDGFQEHDKQIYANEQWNEHERELYRLQQQYHSEYPDKGLQWISDSQQHILEKEKNEGVIKGNVNLNQIKEEPKEDIEQINNALSNNANSNNDGMSGMSDYNDSPILSYQSLINSYKKIGGYNFFNPLNYNSDKHTGKGIGVDRITLEHQYRARQNIQESKRLRNKSLDCIQINKPKRERIKSPTRINKRDANEYQNKPRSKAKYIQLKKDIEEKWMKDHPFKPEINYTEQTKSYQETSQERFKRLSQPKANDLYEQIRVKESQSQSNIKQHSFQPLIIENSSVNPSCVSSRLYDSNEEIKEKKEKMQRDYQDNIIKQYSFTPKINKHSKEIMLKYDKRPIHQRNEEYEKSKNESLSKIRKEIDAEQRSYYKPMINDRSRELAINKLNGSQLQSRDIHEKLYRETIKQNKHSHNKTELNECTFTPQLFYETYGEGGNINDFLERQKVYDEAKKERSEKKLNQLTEKTVYTFHPKINLTSDALIKSNYKLSKEDIDKSVERLSKQDYEHNQQKKERLLSEYNSQYAFKPQINELSRFIGRDSNIIELNQKSKVTPKNKNKKENTVNECTFQPNINHDKFTDVQSHYKNNEEILERINKEKESKQLRVKTIQNVIEKKNAEDCKFKPEINRVKPNFESKEPIIMKGMAKHLEQMEKARKAKRDYDERAKKVFITGENWPRNNMITVPKPFNLSYQIQYHNKGNNLYQKQEISSKNHYNESKNRQIIHQLLKE